MKRQWSPVALVMYIDFKSLWSLLLVDRDCIVVYVKELLCSKPTFVLSSMVFNKDCWSCDHAELILNKIPFHTSGFLFCFFPWVIQYLTTVLHYCHFVVCWNMAVVFFLPLSLGCCLYSFFPGKLFYDVAQKQQERTQKLQCPHSRDQWVCAWRSDEIMACTSNRTISASVWSQKDCGSIYHSMLLLQTLCYKNTKPTSYPDYGHEGINYFFFFLTEQRQR